MQMGTRMVSALEAPIHDNWKNAIIDADETDTIFLNRHHSPGLRALRTERTEALEKYEDNVMGVFGENIMDLYFGGDMEAAVALTGQVAGRIDSVRPVADIIAETSKEFFEVMEDMANKYVRG
ncbi:MAG: enoyl-[acyl-carrier protein] reductase II [Myxococcota bacterium]